MKIIETIKEFNSFLEQSKDYDWLIVPTYCNGSRPVYTDSISIIYVYVLNLDEEVLIVFNHTEGLSLPIELLDQFPKDKNLFIMLFISRPIIHLVSGYLKFFCFMAYLFFSKLLRGARDLQNSVF